MGNTILKPEDYDVLKSKLFNKYEIKSTSMGPVEEKKRKEFLNTISIFEKNNMTIDEVNIELPKETIIETPVIPEETIQVTDMFSNSSSSSSIESSEKETNLDKIYDEIIENAANRDMIAEVVEEMNVTQPEELENKMDPELADMPDPEMEVETNTQETEINEEFELYELIRKVKQILNKLIPRKRVEFEEYHNNMIRTKYKHTLVLDQYSAIFTEKVLRDADFMADLTLTFTELSNLKTKLADIISNNQEMILNKKIINYEKLLDVLNNMEM